MRIKQRFTMVAVFLCWMTVLMFCSWPVSAAARADTPVWTNEVPFESYTYWEDYGTGVKTPVYCRPMYQVKAVIDAKSLGVETFYGITDICADENGRTYILDGEASKIYIADKSYCLTGMIEELSYQGEPLSIEGASGIFVRNGKIYIADTKQERVLVLGPDGEVLNLLTLPDSKLIPDDFVYRPIKVAVDSKNYMYIASDGSYYGALVYSPSMEFLGFFGANTVKATMLDILQNLADRLFSNDTKKAADVLALPYQLVDLVVGPEDFIYTTTGKINETELQTGQVSIMNPGGIDILDMEDYNFADIEVGSYKRVLQTQSLIGIDADKDGFFFVLDAAYGRVFWYDEECNLLSVFGGGLGPGNQKGTFMLANAVAVSGTDVLVSDSQKNTVTVFELTEYGNLVREAQLLTLNDELETAASSWEKVLSFDKNSQLAYRGLAKACYDRGDNNAAAEYAKMGADRETYSNAFVKKRQFFLEQWFPALFAGALVLSAGFIAFGVIRKKKNLCVVTNAKLRVLTSSVFHPFESFRLVKEQKQGSLWIACILLAIYYLVAALKDIAAGYSFNQFDASNYNSFYLLLSTVGLVLLWTGANWLVCTLLGGIGRLGEIFIVVCYSLVPTVAAQAVSTIFTHILVPDEFVFVTIFETICTMYTFFMLMIGTMKIHDYEFGKFLKTTLLTIVAMMIIVFLLFLVFLLAQQVYGWISTIYVEAKYR